MKRILLFLLSALTLLTAAPRKPKLVVLIVIDQLRYDYLTRFRGDFHAGFDQLLSKGAVFTDARYKHFPTVTAVGHSVVATGAMPAVSGIVGNDWFDREEGKHVTSVSDAKTRLLGGNGGEGASPHRLLVSTIGDELKMAGNRKSRVIGISLKDRAAILPAGHMADAAYWFDLNSGNFVSSTYYFADLPGWVKDFNSGHPSEKYRGATWLNHRLPEDLKKLYGNSDESPFESSPFGNELEEMFAERALAAEQLGRHETTDLLTVSFSSNDKVGHDYGPYSAEEREVTLATDKLLERLMQAAERQAGAEQVLYVLSADHGVAPSAEEDAANRMRGGRILGSTIRDAVQAALVKRYGEGDWVSGSWDLMLYLNYDLIARKNLDRAEVDRTAAGVLLAMPHIARVYTREQLAQGSIAADEMGRRFINGFNLRRGPDVEYLPEPYWYITKSATTHGTTYGYDAHVPVIIMGTGIRAGRYYSPVAVNDIAPTLAAILDVEAPSGSVGRVLSEVFAQ